MIIEKAQAKKIVVMLLGMSIPSQVGKEYSVRFQRIYTKLSERFDAKYVPIFFGVSENKHYMQMDAIHPNKLAQPILANNVWRVLEPIL